MPQVVNFRIIRIFRFFLFSYSTLIQYKENSKLQPVNDHLTVEEGEEGGVLVSLGHPQLGTLLVVQLHSL